MNVEDIIDSPRYFSAERYDATVATCRRALAETGCALLPGFVRDTALADMLAEANAAFPEAYRRNAMLTAYAAAEQSGDQRHPTRRTSPYRMHVAAADYFDPRRSLATLHTSPAFIRFVAAILDEPQLFALGDPLLGLTVSYLSEGDEHGWHFDGNDFVVSLALQAPAAGGEFEYAPFVRSADEPNFATVGKLMDGERAALESVAPQPGMLSLFCGKRALHRVAPVRGTTVRVMALLSYDRTPSLVHDAQTQLRVFGRTAIHA